VIALAETSIAFDLPVVVKYFSARRELAREQVALARAARRSRIDVLLAPANRGLPWATSCATVLTLHDAVEWDSQLVIPPRGKSRVRFDYASVLSLAAADLVVTVSHASAERIRERLDVPERRLRVVHEAASERFTCDPGSQPVARVLNQLGFSKPFVLYVGGFETKKDVATLLRAVARIAQLGDDVELVLAGASMTGRLPLEDLTAKLGIASSVHWIGVVEDDELPALYRASHCFVFPAVAEGFGLPVLEAMACGTPVIAARAAALPEVIGNGGLMFAPGDDAELAALLRDVLHASAPQRKALVDRALARAATFSWERTADATERVLREAAAIPPSVRWYRRIAELARWRERVAPRQLRPNAIRRAMRLST
jgi:glycosyltransferase involved in cell wall biosynthesis